MTENESPIVFYSPGSCSFGAIVAFEWVGQPYRLCKVEKAARQTPEYKAINETAQVPALKTGNRVITENSAILQHIAGLDPAKHLAFAQGTQQFDKMNTLLSFFASNFHASFYPYFVPQRYHSDEKIQGEIKEQAVKNIRARYEQVNEKLNGYDFFFGGDKPTIADAYFFGMARWGEKLFDIANEFPNIHRFQQSLGKDHAVQFALAIEKGENARSTGKFEGSVELTNLSQAKAA